MKAKNLISIASLVVLLAIALPARSSLALTVPSPVHLKTEDMRAQQLIQRLETINSMDKSTMSKSERKKLRKEVKHIKKELKPMGGGVYLSVGAILIIILLLILIL
jgi:hypothetical protein